MSGDDVFKMIEEAHGWNQDRPALHEREEGGVVGTADWDYEPGDGPQHAEDEKATAAAINRLSRWCRKANDTWWRDPATGEPLPTRNKGELLMLMVSELSEAMEGERKGLADDKLPYRSMAEVELADCLIRIFDYAGGFGYDLGGAFVEKMRYNAQRPDHEPENRIQEGGKKW